MSNEDKLIEVIYEIRERVARMEERIEEKFTRLDRNELKIENLEDKVTEALLHVKENEKKIESLQQLNKWIWGFIISGIGSFVLTYFKLK